MAEIKMDITEYEALKRIETDLRDSLKKQESLNEEIKKLQQEKIELAEANASKVCVVTTHINHNIINTPTVSKDILDLFHRFDEDIYGERVRKIVEKNRVEESTTYKQLDYIGFDEVREQIRAEEAKKVGLDFEEVKKLREFKLDYQAFTNSHLKSIANLTSKLNSYKKLVKEAEELLSTIKNEVKKSWFSSVSVKTESNVNHYVTVEEKIKKIEEAKKLESEISL